MNLGETVWSVLIVGAWVFGIAAAKGFWMTLVCVCLPPVAWVVLAQRLMEGGLCP